MIRPFGRVGSHRSSAYDDVQPPRLDGEAGYTHGVTSYRYDPTGRIEQAVGPGYLNQVVPDRVTSEDKFASQPGATGPVVEFGAGYFKLFMR